MLEEKQTHTKTDVEFALHRKHFSFLIRKADEDSVHTHQVFALPKCNADRG